MFVVVGVSLHRNKKSRITQQNSNRMFEFVGTVLAMSGISLLF